MPKKLLLPPLPDGTPTGVKELIDYVYGDRVPHVPDQPGAASTLEIRQHYSTTVKSACEFYKDKGLLAPKNNVVSNLNDAVMARLASPPRTYLSADAVERQDGDNAVYTTEFLNTLNLSGMPRHRLEVKVGCVLMLMRNLNPKEGLCNGTRLLLTKAGDRVLEGVILTGIQYE